MQLRKSALGAGVAAIAVVGCCGLAFAQGLPIHTMTVNLPGGGVEQIRYTVAPRVTVSNTPAPIFAAMPSFFGAGSPFAGLERISAAMDRRADQMLREAAALQAGATQPNLTAIGTMPAGSHEYTFVSEMNGNNVCSRSMTITSQGNGAPPRVVTHTSGNCSAPGAPQFRVPTQLPTAPAPGNGPRTIMTNAVGAHPYAGLVHEASLQ